MDATCGAFNDKALGAFPALAGPESNWTACLMEIQTSAPNADIPLEKMVIAACW